MCETSFVKDKNKSECLELERDHQMLVQQSQFHTQGWRANGDISLILSRGGPDNLSVVKIIATEKICIWVCLQRQHANRVLSGFIL